MINQLTNELRDHIKKISDARREEIRNSYTTPFFPGTAYYVSNSGSDDNDGKTPETAWKTLKKVGSHKLEPGDAVLFKRGDMFRGSFKAQEGVTYSAYGIGAKPIISASPMDGAKVGEWLPTEIPDIYRYSEKIRGDVGCIIFDNKEFGIKALVDFEKNFNLTTETDFNSWHDLGGDLEFYHDLGGAGNLYGTEKNSTIYLKSTKGNPAERFSSIEFNERTNGITVVCNDVRINNLCIKNCGNHGIGAIGGVNDPNDTSVRGLHVDWCEFEWIGGSIQGFNNNNVSPFRFGNAIEIYGGCNDYIVENCYINQVYDAGITHQYSAGGKDNVIMEDIVYKGNLIENCTFSIEYFCGGAEEGSSAERKMSHVRMSDNIMLNSGYGFGKQRPWRSTTACHIKSWDHVNNASDMIYEKNIMFHSGHALIHIACLDEKCMPILRRNIFIQKSNGKFAKLGATPTEFIMFTEKEVSSQNYIGNDNSFFFDDLT